MYIIQYTTKNSFLKNDSFMPAQPKLGYLKTNWVVQTLSSLFNVHILHLDYAFYSKLHL